MAAVVQSAAPLHTQEFINFETLLHRVLQRSYGTLMQLAEQSEQVDSQRKRSLLDWFAQTRADLIRALVLLKWARTVPDMSHCTEILSFLQSQDTSYQQAADMLFAVREKMEAARAPIFDVPTAIDVLSTGSYIRLPTCIQNIVPPAPVESEDEKAILNLLSNMIHLRLFNTSLPPQFNFVKIVDGRLILRVDAEFELALTIEGESTKYPWKVLSVEVLVDSSNGSENPAALLPPNDSSVAHTATPFPIKTPQLQYLCDLVQRRIADAQSPLEEAYIVLHCFCVSLQLESLWLQASFLSKERRWADTHNNSCIRAQYLKDTSITIFYWPGVSTSATVPPNPGGVTGNVAPNASASLRAPASVTPVPGAPAQADVHHVQVVIDENQSLVVQQHPKLTGARLPKVDPRNLNMEEILLRSINLHAQAKLLQLQEALLTDETLGMLPEHISVTAQPGPPELAVHTLLISLGVDRQIQIRVNSRTGRFSLKLPPMAPARGDRVVVANSGALSSAALTLQHQAQAEESLNSTKEGVGAAIRRIVFLQKHQAVVETFLNLAMMLYPTVLEPLRSIPIDGKPWANPELYLRFIDAPAFYVQIEVDANFQPLFHLMSTHPSVDPSGAIVLHLTEPQVPLSPHGPNSESDLDNIASSDSSRSIAGKRHASTSIAESTNSHKKQKGAGNQSTPYSNANGPSTVTAAQQKKQLLEFTVYRQYLIHVIETTRRSKINRLLLMRAFDTKGIRCRGSAADKMELIGLSAYGVDILQPANAHVLLSANRWEARIVESARVLRKIKFQNTNAAPTSGLGESSSSNTASSVTVRYLAGQWMFSAERFDLAAVDSFVNQLRALTLLMRLCVKLEKLMENPGYQQLFVNVFKIQSLTAESLSIQHDPDAVQLLIRVVPQHVGNGSGSAPGVLANTSTSSSMSASMLAASSASAGAFSSSNLPLSSPNSSFAYSLSTMPHAHPAARLFATMLHASENDLGRLFEHLHFSMRPYLAIQTLVKSQPPAEILVLPRGTSHVRLIFRSTYAIDVNFRSAHSVAFEDTYTNAPNAPKSVDFKLQPITQLVNLMDRLSRSGIQMEKTRSGEFVISHSDFAAVLSALSKFIGSLYLLRKIPFLLFEMDPTNKVSPPDLTKLMMRFQRSNYQIGITLADFQRLEFQMTMFLTSANPSNAADSLLSDETETLSQYFKHKVAVDPFRVAAMCSFLGLLCTTPFSLLREVIQKVLSHEKDPSSSNNSTRLELTVPPHHQLWTLTHSANGSSPSSYPPPGTPAIMHDKPNSELCCMFRFEDSSGGSSVIPLRFAYATNRISLWLTNRADEKHLDLSPTGEKTMLSEAVKLMREQPDKLLHVLSHL